MSVLRYLLTFLILLTVSAAAAGDSNIFFRDDFNDLANWKPLDFPRVKKHSTYSIEKQGDESFLKAQSDASASAIVFRETFNAFDYPKVKWRWKVDNVYKKGDALEKSGDDYPIRIYIFFEYDSKKASLGEKIKFALAKAFYGEYPPYSSLNYIWESRPEEKKIITSTYAKESQMIVLEAGKENVGRWMDEEVNIIEDYHKAFGEDPPPAASIAIMNDSDDTGESSTSYIDYIQVYR